MTVMSELLSGRAKATSAKRRRHHAIRVYVDAAENALIEGHATSAGMSASNFLRALGLGHEPASTFDHTAVRELGRVAGDQGRLGGLLKQWLSTRPGEGASEHDVARLLDELLLVQSEIRERVASL
jgi:hypothetical protein